jgi:hypothetical protein
MSPEDRAQPIERLVSSVSIWGPPSERQALLENIFELAPEVEDAIAVSLPDVIDVATQLREVNHGDRSESSPDPSASLDVEAENLGQLIAHGDGKSDYGDGIDYSYARAVERLVARASKSEIEHFVGLRPHVERDAKATVAISRRMLALGDRTAALQYCAKAELASASGHWSTFLGGQKLEVQRLRIALEGDAARESGFDLLVGELAGGQTYASSLFLNLDDVLELVTIDFPFERLWIETEEHLKQYREFRLAAPIISLPAVETHSDFLAFIVAKAFDFSCPQLLQHARAAAMLVARHAKDSAFIEKLFELLEQQSEGQRESAALMDRLRDAPHLQEALFRKAAADATSDDFIVANVAKRVLDHFGAPFHQPPAVALPAFYNLVTLESAQADNFDPPPGIATGHRPIWSDDPWTWTVTLRSPLKLLSKGCYIPMDLLRRRCAGFMTREGGRAAFGPEVEDAIPARLRRMHLHFSYRRPLPIAALRAFGKVLQELDAADAVDPNMFQAIWSDIGGPSLSDWQTEIVPRPSWIAIPTTPRRQYGGIDRDVWLEQADTALASTFPPDGLVIAEHTHFRIQAQRAAAHTSRVSLPNPASPEEGIDSLPRLLSIDRLAPMYRENESQLVCQIPSDLFGDLRDPAMTVCPYVARSLGWTRSATSPFILTEPSGEIVARTIRWIDGTNRESGYDAELFGFGQAVVLSPNGRAQLEAWRGHVCIGVSVERSVVDESGRPLSRTITAHA